MKRDPELKLETVEGVYAPAEDSELLIESIDPAAKERVLEVGTGSGIVAAHCAAAGAQTTATDINPVALACALKNARVNGLEIGVLACNLADGVRGPFDLVLFNPPYLPGKMGQAAADGGAGGIDVVSGLLRDLPRILAPDGMCVIVLSSHSDMRMLEQRFPSLAFQPLRTKKLFFEVLTSYGVRPTKKQ